MTKTQLHVLPNLTLLFVALAAQAATPTPIDRGPLSNRERATPISITLALALSSPGDAESALQAINTPGSPEYRHFLTPDQFAARFGPSDADVANVVAAFARHHLSAERTSPTTLRVTGAASDMERVFSVSLHTYEVATHDGRPGYTFHAPVGRPIIPEEASKAVSAVVGLDSHPAARPLHRTYPAGARPVPAATPNLGKSGNPFGLLTVGDFAQQYDVLPLYAQGVTGSGRTIAVLTLASFTPSDAYAYWAALGLNVASNRISIVDIDGGPVAPSDASGSIETTIDVEQSGGVAPGAKIIVYQAPDTGVGPVDAFAKAVADNKADGMSISWGLWEVFQISTPYNATESVAQALHNILLEAAMQGQSAFAASGDGGAYDVDNNIGCYGPYNSSVANSCSLALSVDYPASDTLITAGGGTTLAGHQSYCLNAACTAPFSQIQIPRESVWGWDYLVGLCQTLGFDPISCGIFPAGGGGGVSVVFAQPSYQAGIPGMQLSQPDQNFFWQPYGLVFSLPALYPGRNVPDVSFNADPDTGYVVLYTSDKTGFGAYPYYGGTSFVSQQLNGVTMLLVQYLNSRVGLLNFPLYTLAATGQAYGGVKAPLNQITAGDNWFYSGSLGYNLGAGLGTIDVANLAAVLSGKK